MTTPEPECDHRVHFNSKSPHGQCSMCGRLFDGDGKEVFVAARHAKPSMPALSEEGVRALLRGLTAKTGGYEKNKHEPHVHEYARLLLHHLQPASTDEGVLLETLRFYAECSDYEYEIDNGKKAIQTLARFVK